MGAVKGEARLIPPQLILKPGREKSVRQRHPWIFSGSIREITGSPGLGDTVDVLDNRGEWLARAGYSPQSQITARIWTWSESQTVDESFFVQSIRQAVENRSTLRAYTNGIRLVNAENDGLPGLILDSYDGYLVVQFLSAGAEHWRKEILGALSQLPNTKGVFERSDVEVREKEGLPLTQGALQGQEPPPRIGITEGDWKFLVDVRKGHKTGFYLDQRENRTALADLISRSARGKEILNVFSYTGAFAVVAYASGAGHVLNVDSSEEALSFLDEHFSINGIPPVQNGSLAGNAFEVLRKFRDQGRSFDVIILDPPKLAQSQRDIDKSARAYKDINWLSMRLLRPNGYLITFSCSGLVNQDLFQKILFSASLDAGRDVQIIQSLGQPMDHPVRLSFPEGKYLKGFICRVA
jgi:23S rRNA (cytosine1962-C5)-methyltransferase